MTARLGILLSGTGTTYQAVADAVASGAIPAAIAVVVSSRAEAGGVERARIMGHPVVIAEAPDAVTAALESHGASHVVMCGWLRSWDPPAKFHGRTFNVHPSLLPAFGGKGMYGRRVHQAVLDRGCKITGCTVHLVAGDYDSGPILAQEVVTVLAEDTAASLQARVQAIERHLYPQVIGDVIAGRKSSTASS